MKFLAALALVQSLVFTTPSTDPPPAATKPGAIVELQLIGEVDRDSTQKVIDAIDRANRDQASAIVIEIDSPGGDVNAGLPLAKKIERSKVPVACVVDGEAASMASYLLESCSTRVMTKRSTLMIHEMAYYFKDGFGGQPTRWQNIADDLRVSERAAAEHYALRMGLPVKFIIDQIYGGRSWYMGWEDAQKYHAIDIVVDSYDDFLLKK